MVWERSKGSIVILNCKRHLRTEEVFSGITFPAPSMQHCLCSSGSFTTIHTLIFWPTCWSTSHRSSFQMTWEMSSRAKTRSLAFSVQALAVAFALLQSGESCSPKSNLLVGRNLQILLTVNRMIVIAKYSDSEHLCIISWFIVSHNPLLTLSSTRTKLCVWHVQLVIWKLMSKRMQSSSAWPACLHVCLVGPQRLV